MAVSDQLKALVDQMPDPDSRGMYTEKVDKEKIEKAIAAIYEGGPENIRGLIEMLDEPGSAEDAKPHYALHGVLNHTLVIKDQRARKQFCNVLAEELSNEYSDYIKSFLCQTLGWAGRRESVSALGRLLLNEALCDAAAMALAAIQEGAAEELRRALPQASGRARLVILHSLAALADPASAHAFGDALEDPDCEVRIAAGAGLASLGDPGAIDALLQAADRAEGWERIQATKHCLVLAEKLAAAGRRNEAARVYAHLRDTRNDPSERYVREAAERALASG